MTITELKSVLAGTGIPLHHDATKTLPRLPYMVYTEYHEKYEKADDRIDDVITSVQVDLYEPIDGNYHKNIRIALDAARAAFETQRLVETNTNGKNGVSVVVHWVFDCEVFDDG